MLADPTTPGGAQLPHVELRPSPCLYRVDLSKVNAVANLNPINNLVLVWRFEKARKAYVHFTDAGALKAQFIRRTGTRPRRSIVLVADDLLKLLNMEQPIDDGELSAFCVGDRALRQAGRFCTHLPGCASAAIDCAQWIHEPKDLGKLRLVIVGATHNSIGTSSAHQLGLTVVSLADAGQAVCQLAF